MVKVNIQMVENMNFLFLEVFGDIFLRMQSSKTMTSVPAVQIRILYLLGSRGPKRMTDIADALSVSMPASTAIVEKMVQARLVQRQADPQDRRVILVSLTDEGQKALKGVLAVHEARTKEVLSLLPPPKQQKMIDAFQCVYDLLQEIQAASPSNKKDGSRKNGSHA
jgi:DNA-binding MarR family transcriptional regulator